MADHCEFFYVIARKTAETDSRWFPRLIVPCYLSGDGEELETKNQIAPACGSADGCHLVFLGIV
ncbi:MAG TPA: hypothetical protein VLL07_05795 [Pontiella sp.]|nr:hypothetical protein [Pontiella sp.]